MSNLPQSPIAPSDEWREVSEYGWTHPERWTIEPYIVSGVEKCLLWTPEGRPRGDYTSVGRAKAAFRKMCK